MAVQEISVIHLSAASMFYQNDSRACLPIGIKNIRLLLKKPRRRQKDIFTAAIHATARSVMPASTRTKDYAQDVPPVRKYM